MTPWIFWSVFYLLALIGFFVWTFYTTVRAHLDSEKEWSLKTGEDFDYDKELRRGIIGLLPWAIALPFIVGLCIYFILVVNALRTKIKRELSTEALHHQDVLEDAEDDLSEVDLEDPEVSAAPPSRLINLASLKFKSKEGHESDNIKYQRFG